MGSRLASFGLAVVCGLASRDMPAAPRRVAVLLIPAERAAHTAAMRFAEAASRRG